MNIIQYEANCCNGKQREGVGIYCCVILKYVHGIICRIMFRGHNDKCFTLVISLGEKIYIYIYTYMLSYEL